MKSIIVMVFALVIAQNAHGITAPSHGQLCKTIEPALQPYIDYGLFQGNVLLAKDGKVLCHYSSGFTHANKQTPISTDSRFPIASLSKPIVAALALILQERGVIELNQSLQHYLPDFNAPWANTVSLHHLLSNRSGLPNHFTLPGWKSGEYKRVVPTQQLLDDIAHIKLTFSPGDDYLYTNLGWLLLGEAIAEVTGNDLATNLREFVFAPLAMHQSGLVSDEPSSMISGLGWNETRGWRDIPPMHMQLFDAGAGIYSTTQDLLRFLHGVHNNQFLTQSSTAQLFSEKTPYGWRTESIELTATDQLQVHSYDGQLLGHSSLVYQTLDDNISLIVLTNTGMGYAHKKALAGDVLRAYYQLPLPNREQAATFVLQQSLLTGQWRDIVEQLRQQPIADAQSARLVYDLAQQLEWSSQAKKAITLYHWLASSFTDNVNLQHTLQRLCERFPQHADCQKPPKVNVGMSILPLTDDERSHWRLDQPRPMTTHLFYPTADTPAKALNLGPPNSPFFKAGSVVSSAAPRPAAKPLVIMSHGTGGSAPQMLWLAQALVEQGYVVAAVNHHGNTALESTKYPEGFLLWWERARDLQVVEKMLSENPAWGPIIDSKRIAVVGFSLGGYTALSTLGGITDKALFDSYCEHAHDDFSCQPQPEFKTVLTEFEQIKQRPAVLDSLARQHNRFAIDNVKAAVLIAPAIVHAFRPKSLKNITTPTLLITGDKDVIAPTKPNGSYAHQLLTNSQIVNIEGAHHYSFLSLCTESGKNTLTELCGSPHGVSRQAVHQQTIKAVLSFLQENL